MEQLVMRPLQPKGIKQIILKNSVVVYAIMVNKDKSVEFLCASSIIIEAKSLLIKPANRRVE